MIFITSSMNCTTCIHRKNIGVKKGHSPGFDNSIGYSCRENPEWVIFIGTDRFGNTIGLTEKDLCKNYEG
jgi:hypothetical protein